MGQKIKIRRGLKERLPELDVGELGFCTDSLEIFIGSPQGNKLLNVPYVTEEELNGLAQSLTDELSNKAETNHQHRLEELLDLDVTNKTDGYALIFDSNSNMFKSKALPYVEGGSTNFTLGNSYLIELDRWGITQGVSVKPYTADDYYMANNNISGINSALQWAYENGYSEVVFPRGQYAICYPNPIRTQADMVINFNRSTFKVIYDSIIRSPLDTRPADTPVYEFGGTSILCATPNTHIINLTLIGERIDRSWVEKNGSGISKEQSLETTTGIKLITGSDRSSVKHCNISHYMADAIYIGFDGYTNMPSIGNMEFGDIDATGNLITGSDPKMIRTVGDISLPEGVKSFALIGLGYISTTSIPNGMYNVYFYRADNSFTYKQMNVRTRDTVEVPKDATKFKLTWIGDGTTDQGLLPNNPPYWANLIQLGISDSVVVEYNEIHRCNRGGLFLGANNVMIRKNHFHNVGYQGDTDLDGIGTFTDFTRYSITTEDHIGHNCKIIDNVFENTRMAVAVRGEYNEVTGNEFKNCTYSVILYSQRHITVNKNIMYYAGVHCYPYNEHHRNWIITENIFNYSTLTLTGTGTVSTISNNNFANKSNVIIDMHALNFTNNSFNDSSVIPPAVSETVINGCTFVNGSHIDVFSHTKPYEIINCIFINSYVLGQSSHKVTIKNSRLKESHIRIQGSPMAYRLENCVINNTAQSVLGHPTYSGLGRMTHTLELVNCNISLGQSLISANEWKNLIVRDCNITYNLAANLSNGLIAMNNFTGLVEILNTTIATPTYSITQSVSTATDIIISGSTFNNFSLTGATVQVQSNQMPSVPIGGKYTVGQLIYTTSPTAGGSMGWICIVAGYANDNSWASNKVYTVGQRIYYGNFVYQCTIAGTSGNAAPTFPTTEGSTVIDGGVTWMYLSNKAVFKEFGTISV